MHSTRVTDPEIPALTLAALPTDPSAPIVVGVSGGLDSAALLHLLHANRQNPLIAAHLDHGLRPIPERNADQNALRSLCAPRGIPLITRSVNVAHSATFHSESLETAGRRERLRFLSETALECGASHIALAHHADDQAETLLFRLLRGAGARGLAAMRPITHFALGGNAFQILRPLLHLRKRDLAEIVHREKLPFHEDSSNASNDFARNRIRNTLLPALHEILQRDPVLPIARSAELLAEDDDFLQSLAAHLDPEQPQLPTKALADLAAPVLGRVIQRWLEWHRVPDLSHDHIQTVARLATQTRPAKVNLPGNHVARRNNGRLFIESLPQPPRKSA